MTAFKVLITGASGFIGSHLMDRFLEDNLRVRCLVRSTSSLRFIPTERVELVEGSLSDIDSLRRAADGVDLIVHAAGLTMACREEDYFAVNRTGTSNLLRAAAESSPDLKGFVYLSSLAAGGPSRDGRPLTEDVRPLPVSCYGRSKLAGEEEAKKFSDVFPVVVLRLGAVYGPREKEILEMIRQIRRGWGFHPGRKDIHLSMVYVTDMVQAVALALDNARPGWRLYYVSDGEVHQSGRIMSMIAEMVGKKPVRFRLPLGIVRGVFLSIARFRPEARCAFYLDKISEMRHKYWLCDINKARQELGFQPRVSLRQGLQATISWYRRQGWLK